MRNGSPAAASCGIGNQTIVNLKYSIGEK